MLHFLGGFLSRGILKHSFQSAQALPKKSRYPNSSTQHCEENMSGANDHIWSFLNFGGLECHWFSFRTLKKNGFQQIRVVSTAANPTFRWLQILVSRWAPNSRYKWGESNNSYK